MVVPSTVPMVHVQKMATAHLAAALLGTSSPDILGAWRLPGLCAPVVADALLPASLSDNVLSMALLLLAHYGLAERPLRQSPRAAAYV